MNNSLVACLHNITFTQGVSVQVCSLSLEMIGDTNYEQNNFRRKWSNDKRYRLITVKNVDHFHEYRGMERGLSNSSNNFFS